MTIPIELSPTQGAYVAMVLAEHESAVRTVDAVRDRRMSILLRECAIPEGQPVRWHRAVEGGPMILLYEGTPDASSDPAANPVVDPRNPPVREHEGA